MPICDSITRSVPLLSLRRCLHVSLGVRGLCGAAARRIKAAAARMSIDCTGYGDSQLCAVPAAPQRSVRWSAEWASASVHDGAESEFVCDRITYNV